MADLIARSPCEGLLPMSVGTVTLTEINPVYLSSLSASAGNEVGLSESLLSTHGVALPKPNRSTAKKGVRAIWFGHNQIMLMGSAPDTSLGKFASVTDQSDGWAVVQIEGSQAEAVLARLVPIDLRQSTFKRGHCARTTVQHMQASILRLGEQSFQIMVFRSMAQSLVHDLSSAMRMLDARANA